MNLMRHYQERLLFRRKPEDSIDLHEIMMLDARHAIKLRGWQMDLITQSK